MGKLRRNKVLFVAVASQVQTIWIQIGEQCIYFEIDCFRGFVVSNEVVTTQVI